MKNAPYIFDGPYAGCYDYRTGAMDERHVYIIHEILKAWPFDNALEIGSLNGASTTAFIEAINAGRMMNTVVCDTRITPSLLSVARNCNKPQAVKIVTDPSWHVLAGEDVYDFILVDANHDAVSVGRELVHLLFRRPLCIMAHDTNAHDAGYPWADGAKMLKDAFTEEPGYICIEDAADRPGEETKRGLFLATTDAGLAKVAQWAFKKYCKESEPCASV